MFKQCRLVQLVLWYAAYWGSLSDAKHLPYKTIYWRGINNIGDWRFFRKFPNVKIANINNYMDTPTKPLLKTKKLKKKDVVARIANIKSANCFSQTNSPNITLTNKYSCMVFVCVFFCTCPLCINNSCTIMYVLMMHLASHQAWLLSKLLTVINNDIPRPNKPWPIEGLQECGS